MVNGIWRVGAVSGVLTFRHVAVSAQAGTTKAIKNTAHKPSPKICAILEHHKTTIFVGAYNV